jgi:diguanylate cyclase (GGDEF)-like protein
MGLRDAPPLDPTALSLRHGPRWVRGLLIATVAIVAVYFVSVLPGMPGRPGTIPFWETWVRSAAYAGAAAICAARAVLVRAERPAWTAMSAALVSYTAGYVGFGLVYSTDAQAPYVSFADALWLGFYPLSYIALVLLVRDRVRHFHRSTWLDGLVAGLAAAALSAAVAYDVLISDVGGEPLTVAVNLAYPIADLLLIVTVICVFGLTGWRPGRAWLLLGAAMLANSIADAIYLLEAAHDTYVEGTWLDAVWPCAFLAMGLAAWQKRPNSGARAGEWRALAVPSISTLVAVGVLAASALGEEHRIAVALALAAVLLSVARTAITFREVRHLAETRLQAVTDDLTGLPNRRAVNQRLAADVDGGRPTGLLFVDLDGFKDLNDTLGHDVGDRLLELLGARLADHIGDRDLFGRLGGDEFALVLADCPDDETAVAAAERLRAALETPFTLDGIPVQIDASIGIAVFPLDAATTVELLKRADVALYQAKRDRTGIARYSPDRDGNTRDRLVLLGELRAGIPRGELELHYQPQIEIGTGRLSGLEALVRWQHPVHGRLMPPAFLPGVEQTSLMRPFTERVIEDALRQAAAWAGGPLDVPIAVNVAAANLLDAEFPATVDRLLREAGIAPERLCIEVTENAVMTDADRTIGVLAALRRRGVRVSIDDFGTGHSSLARLKHLPVDEIKIDKDFVFHMSEDDRDAAIVEATVTVAQRLDLTVIAEGIETPAAWERLRELGCHHAQGYFVSRPVAPAELEAWRASDALEATLSIVDADGVIAAAG